MQLARRTPPELSTGLGTDLGETRTNLGTTPVAGRVSSSARRRWSVIGVGDAGGAGGQNPAGSGSEPTLSIRRCHSLASAMAVA